MSCPPCLTGTHTLTSVQSLSPGSEESVETASRRSLSCPFPLLISLLPLHGCVFSLLSPNNVRTSTLTARNPCRFACATSKRRCGIVRYRCIATRDDVHRLFRKYQKDRYSLRYTAINPCRSRGCHIGTKMWHSYASLYRYSRWRCIYFSESIKRTV